MSGRTSLPPCVAALLALSAASAHAQRTSSLSWVRLEGAEDCISTQALAERVERRLGRRVFVSASQADLSLEGRVERTAEPPGVVATLVVSDRDGRELGRRVLRVDGASCQPLEASLVLVIAIAIDPGATLPAVMDGANELSEDARAMLAQLDLPELDAEQIAQLAVPDPVATREQPQSGPVRIAAQQPAAGDAHAASPPEAAKRVALRVSVGLTVELGVLPDPAPGAALGVSIAAPAFVPVDVWVSGVLAQEQSAAGEVGAGELQLFAGGLALCPALEPAATLTLRACAGARAGVLYGRGRGFSQPSSSSGAWLEAVLQGGVWLRIGRASLHATAGAGAPAVRDTFSYVDSVGERRSLHRPAPVTARFELGAGMHF